MIEVTAKVLEDLLDVGIALSSTRDLNTLLSLILTEARRFTTADAGTLYLVKGDRLCAEIAQNQTLVDRLGKEEADRLFTSFSIPIDEHSIAGAAAVTREVINIPDVQDPNSNARFRYNPSFDHAHDYSTHSNLAVPMLDREGVVIGVLQLINAQENHRIVPFDESRVKLARALASQAAVAIRNAILTENLREAHLDTLRRLGIAAEWRDKETANHITRVAHYCRLLAEAMGEKKEWIQSLFHASPMHDVGKLGIPDAILHKPGKLDPEERAIMETHTKIGSNIMKKAKNEVMEMARVIALGHHEKWNGEGYPLRRAGKAIPLPARICAIADVYDALSCQRCYKPPFPEEKVLAILKEESGRHFDPELMEVFLTILPKIYEIRDRYADRESDFLKFRDYKNITIEEECEPSPPPPL